MSLPDDKLTFLPNVTYTGEKDRTQFRQMTSQLDVSSAIRTVIRNTPEGKVTLRTRNNFPLILSERLRGAEVEPLRSLCVGATGIALGVQTVLKKFVVTYTSATGAFTPLGTPVVVTPTSYHVSAIASTTTSEDPLKHFSDVYNLATGRLYISTAKSSSTGLNDIPMLLPNRCHGTRETHSHNAPADIQDFHIFSVSEVLNHIRGDGTGDASLNVAEAISDALPPTVTTLESAVVPASPTRVAFFGSTVTLTGYNNDYLNGYGYHTTVTLSPDSPYFSTPSVEEYYYIVTPNSSPTDDAPPITLAEADIPLPSSIPKKARGLHYASYRHLPSGIWSGPSQYYYIDYEYEGQKELDVVRADGYYGLEGSSSNTRNSTETIGAVTLSDGVKYNVVRTWTTSCSYTFRQHSGGYWTEYHNDIPENQSYEYPWLDYGGIYYDRGTTQPTYGWNINFIGDGSGHSIDSNCAMSLDISVAGIKLVDISAERSDARDQFAGWVSTDNPAWREKAISVTEERNGNQLEKAYMLLVPYDEPPRMGHGFAIIGYDNIMRVYTEEYYESSRVVQTINKDETTATDTLKVHAEDVMYYDPKNDVLIKFVFDGSGDLSSSSCSLSLVVSAKGESYTEQLCAAAGDGINLGIDHRNFVLNATPPCNYHPVPANIPGVFAPEGDQGRVSYLCYTTAEEETRFASLGATADIRQYLIALRLWFGRAQRHATFEDPEDPPVGAQYIKLYNIEPCAATLDGGLAMLYSMYYTLKQFTFSNQGRDAFENTLWPNTAKDKVITCWRV